jgi:integrase
MNKPRYKRPAAIDLGDLHLSIVRGPNAEGRWYWRARDADRATVWTGWATRDEAAREGASLLNKPSTPAPRSNVKTVREMIAAWREVQRERVELAPYTHTNHGHRAQHLVQHLGELPVTKVNRDALEGYVRARLAEGGSLRTIHGELTSLGHAWRVAVERGLIEYRALPKLSLRIDPKVFTINHRTPTQEEVSRALAKLPAEEALTVQLLAATGARIGEVLALRREPDSPDARRAHPRRKDRTPRVPAHAGAARLDLRAPRWHRRAAHPAPRQQPPAACALSSRNGVPTGVCA